MPTCHTSDAMRRPGIGMALLLSASACGPPRIAPGLTRRSLERVHIGMTDATVRQVLGTPLRDVMVDQGRGAHRLVYAELGESTRGVRNVSCQVIVAGGRVAYILVDDHGVGPEDRMVSCGCGQEVCPPDWIAPCLAGLPEGAASN